jgi:hypothetical protein
VGNGSRRKEKAMSADADLIKLVRRFEPILYFHSKERFFPSDAKRYIEHSALWKSTLANDGKLVPADPMIKKKKIAAFENEKQADQRFLGEKLSDTPFFLAPDCFFELAGWKTIERRYSNLEELAKLYDPETNGEEALVKSRFWYHAEFFGAVRLRDLINMPVTVGLDLSKVFNKLIKKHPNPAMLCYYFFFPGHIESLAGPCADTETGKQFASFAGEWACLALLLDRQSDNQDYEPQWIGYTGRRNLDSTQGLDNEKRVGMTVEKWKERIGKLNKPLPATIDDHAALFVSLGTHSLYLEPGEHKVDPYPSESFPKWCGQFDGPDALNQYLTSQPPSPEEGSPVAAWGKILGAGFLLGIGPPGLIAGAVLTALEGLPLFPESETPEDELLAPLEAPQPDRGPEPGSNNRVVVPKNVPIDDLNNVRVEWIADEDVPIDGRQYNFIVDRQAQVWWPSDDGTSGYRGRWGPPVALDPFNRRAGMRFPEFWRMFFVALAKLAPQEFEE